MKTITQNQKLDLARMFDALGHPRRIAIFLTLQKARPEGLRFGMLAQQTNMTESSLTHHIKMMQKGGIVSAKSKGPATVLGLNLSQLKQAQGFLSL